MKKIAFGCGVIALAILLGCGVFVYDFITPSRGEPIGTYQSPRAALLVIDIQRDLTEPGGKVALDPELSTRMIQNVNKLIGRFQREGQPIVFIRHEYRPNPLIELLTKGALKEGTPGADLDPRVDVVGANEFIKHKMDPFKGTPLDEFLKANRVDHVYVTGLDAKLCIDRTIRAACNRKLKVTVVADGIGASTEEILRQKLEEYPSTCARIQSTDELMANLPAR